jgi:uncharacterized protein (TIGR00255 family)
MTGYGRGEASAENRKFSVEIRSVNHRYNDVNIKLPRTMNFLEDNIRKTIKNKVHRGKVDVYISFESSSKDDVQIILNEALADAYVDHLKILKKRHDVIDDISVSLIAKFPEVISVDKKTDEEDFLWELLEGALEQALASFLAMREKEGQILKQDLLNKEEAIQILIRKIQSRSPLVVQEYKQKLENRLQDLLNSKEVDENRVALEVAVFADRCSIDEEIGRLESHVGQLENILNTGNVVGRKLDFLVQEMNREANTIGSKANDLEITQTVVELKSEIEKIREQVQNIE